MIIELMIQHYLTSPNIKNIIKLRKIAYLGAKFFLAPCFFMLVCAISWEQRKLEEVITVGNGMDYKHLSEGDIPVYGTGGYMLSVDKALSYDKDAIGIGRKGTIDKPYVLKAPFWTVDTLFYCIPKEDYSLDFVYCIFQNVNWKEKDESTGVPSLSKVNINSTDVKAPTLAEQEKIGAYFSQLDNLITLHQRKCDALQKFKKSMLQKMFPQNGESVPEIRFAGFTDAWEQRELRTAATFSKGSGYSKNDLIENGTPIILYGRLYTKYETVISEVDTFVDVQPNSVYSTGHEVIVPASGETAEDISRASFVAKSGILLGGDLNIIVPDDYINPVFLALTISNGNQQKELSKRAQGKSVVHIHNSDLENVVLLYPKYEEQEKIGEYFSKLDSLITLHQRKLEQEKQKKKALMQLLLTGKVRVKP